MRMCDFDAQYKTEGIRLLAGVDEAGRGPLAGPVYAAAVILPDGFYSEEINDSKKLTEKKRERLYDVICEHALSYCVSAVSARTIDEINILNATHLAMKQAVEELELTPELVLVDGNSSKGLKVPHVCIVGGDAKSQSIAAASILAKVSRDRWCRDVLAANYPLYGFEKHKGYGTKQHTEAILQFGPCEEHRKTFLKKILEKTPSEGAE